MHKCCIFLSMHLLKKNWPSRLICRTQKNTSQESLYLNETKYVNNVLNTFTNKCCNVDADQKCQMVASWDQKEKEKPYDGTFIVIFVPKGMFIMIRSHRKVPLELLLIWGINKRLQPKGLTTNNSRGPGKHRNKPTTTNRYNTKNSQTHMNNTNSRWIWSEPRVVRKSKQFLPIAIHLYVCPSSSLVGL